MRIKAVGFDLKRVDQQINETRLQLPERDDTSSAHVQSKRHMAELFQRQILNSTDAYY